MKVYMNLITYLYTPTAVDTCGFRDRKKRCLQLVVEFVIGWLLHGCAGNQFFKD